MSSCVCYALTSFWTVVFLALAVNAIMMYSSGLGRGAHLAIQFGLLVVGLAYNTAYTTHVKRKRSRPVPTVPASAA
ncbi:hypothetical protein ABZT08_21590 [Streptomyces sp. NPDC005526]|uniref:hypothetical protein n=1 Tax=Streptomyces sp. NPDC005526 TaxID=3156885 RepID=UPI0033A5CE50